VNSEFLSITRQKKDSYSLPFAFLLIKTCQASIQNPKFPMARSIQQIEQDLAALSEQVEVLAERFRQGYTQYLNVLGQSMQKQLVLASYQICTQTYPEAFLSLSFAQRQTLQKNLRQLSQQAREQLLFALEMPEVEEAEEFDWVEESAIAQEAEEPLDLEEADFGPSPEPLEEEDEEEEEESANPSDRLLQWIKQIEQAIQEILQAVSTQANVLLRGAKILPDRLPAKLMEMAVQSEEAGTSVGNSPNLLNLLVEAEETDSEKESTVMQITAVRLRLSELEFADPTLSAERNSLRQSIATAKKLAKQYQKYQRECAIAQAELAWRASWYEE
jgi:hypothetical protein